MKYCLPILLSALLFVTSCGDNPQEEALKGIDEALSLLTEDKCDKAIAILEDLEDQEDNPVYLKTFASAYACKAGFNMVRFLSDDVEDIDETNVLGSVSILTYSDETALNSAKYLAMKNALTILGRDDFQQTTRNADFGPRHGEDMGVQVLIYSIVQFGKYVNWYGNVNTVGKKGAGTNTNSCYLNYSYAAAVAVIGGLPASNACQTTNNGHPDLNGASKIVRMCEGITLMTNIIDVLEEVDLSNSSTLSSLENIVAEIDTYRTAAQAAGVEYLLDVTSPDACETLLADPAKMNDAELLFATVFESEHE